MLYDQDRTKKREERYAKELKYNELNPKPGLVGKTQNWLKDLIGGFFGKGKLTEFKVEKSREELLIDAKVKKYGIKFDPLGNVMMEGFIVPEELRITEAEKNDSTVYDNKQLQQIGMYNEKAKKELEKQQEEARKKLEEANRIAKEQKEQKKEKAKQDKEKDQANKVARDKRLEDEVDRRTKEYKLKYDELGNLNMPGFVVPNELKITEEERKNKQSLLNKKLQQIDLYLDFKEQQDQARREADEKQRKAKEDLEDKLRKEKPKQIEPKPKSEIPVKPELPVPVVSEPVSVTHEPKPVKRVPVPDFVNDARRKYFDRIRKQPPIGGSGIDPLKLARTTINSSNLADSSTGTKGVIPSFFDQAASKYGKHIKQIDVNNDDEIKAAELAAPYTGTERGSNYE